MRSFLRCNVLHKNYSIFRSLKDIEEVGASVTQADYYENQAKIVSEEAKKIVEIIDEKFEDEIEISVTFSMGSIFSVSLTKKNKTI